MFQNNYYVMMVNKAFLSRTLLIFYCYSKFFIVYFYFVSAFFSSSGS